MEIKWDIHDMQLIEETHTIPRMSSELGNICLFLSSRKLYSV